MINKTIMKKYKHLAFLTLTLALVACNNEKKTDFSIAVDTANMKQVYSLGEPLSLQLKDTPDTTIDSVQYFVNDKKVGSVKGNEVLNYTLSSEKHGAHAIKAIAFVKGASYETTSGINIYSKIQPAFYSYTILDRKSTRLNSSHVRIS